jgi:two-component system sensor kinase FixL
MQSTIITPVAPAAAPAPAPASARAPRRSRAATACRDGLTAFTALGDPAALLDRIDQTVLQVTPALQTLLPLPAGQVLPWSEWAQAMAGLAEGLQAHATGPRRWQCGDAMAYAAESAPLDERHLILRLTDQREQQRERLRELQRQLDDRESLLFTSRSVSVGEMGSTLAHELNQPIGAAANLLRGLRVRLARRATHDSAQEELGAVERAIEQVMFAARVIARIREFTHSRAPRQQAVDLGALMRSSASLLDWDLQRVGIALVLDLPAEPLWVLGDEVMLQQVFVNLLRNAIDALRDQPPAAPQVSLTLQVVDGQAQARISDNGIGLPADAASRLFVPFASTKPTGMGIGLSICRSFVELHQGRLWFSAPAERGCSVHLSLPLHSPVHATSPSHGLTIGEPAP